jgi:hypothetical protein
MNLDFNTADSFLVNIHGRCSHVREAEKLSQNPIVDPLVRGGHYLRRRVSRGEIS